MDYDRLGSYHESLNLELDETSSSWDTGRYVSSVISLWLFKADHVVFMIIWHPASAVLCKQLDCGPTEYLTNYPRSMAVLSILTIRRTWYKLALLEFSHPFTLSCLESCLLLPPPFLLQVLHLSASSPWSISRRGESQQPVNLLNLELDEEQGWLLGNRPAVCRLVTRPRRRKPPRRLMLRPTMVSLCFDCGMQLAWASQANSRLSINTFVASDGDL